jgi:hypothetical protein
MGYTIVDSLDSLLLMGFDKEYERARDWVRKELSFNVPGKVNGFEVGNGLPGRTHTGRVTELPIISL